MSQSVTKNPEILPVALERVKEARAVIAGGNGDVIEGAARIDQIRRMLEANGYTPENTPKTFRLLDLITAECEKRMF